MEILGIDIGGSGIKGAPVDTETGSLITDRYRIPTPQPSKPDAVADVVAEIVEHFDWKGPIGCTFPAVVRRGVVHTAANVDDAWIGTNGRELLQERTGCLVVLLNDADAAGVAEMRFGVGQGHDGVVFMLTFGTGIGSAIFVEGNLLPNTELGHLYLANGMKGEHYAASRVRKAEGLSWEEWALRVDEYLDHLDDLFSPDLFIFGGGVSKKFKKYGRYLTTRAKIVPAQLRNEAGIVGAALTALRLK